MRYDSDTLRARANIYDVARHIGMRISGCYCECVSGLHAEHQINHCAMYHEDSDAPDHYHCFSCGDSGDALKLVMQYHANVLGTQISFSEACRIVGDSLGGAEMFEEKGGMSRKKPAPLPFTMEELAIAGIDITKPYRLQNLWETDQKVFFKVVSEQAAERMDRLQEMDVCLGKSAEEAKLRAEINRRQEVLQNILKKSGGQPPVRQMFKL